MKYNPNVLDCAAAPIAEAWSWVKNPASENPVSYTHLRAHET